MLTELAESIERLDVGLDGDSLAEALALSDRLTAKLTMAVAAYDASGLWGVDGDVSMTASLRHHGGRSSRDAAALASTARRLQGLPVTARAWLDGSLSGGKYRPSWPTSAR